MKDLLDKITSYNLFNYLLPGIVFVCLIKILLGYDLVQEKELIGAFLYYFIGMVISRFGSIIIEPLLKYIKFVKFSNYADYIKATKLDPKVELFSEVNNTYRTILAMLILLVILKLYKLIEIKYSISNDTGYIFLVVSLLVLFLFSYRKQTAYVSKRVTAANNP